MLIGRIESNVGIAIHILKPLNNDHPTYVSAPEVLVGERQSTAADIWSLGVVIYIMYVFRHNATVAVIRV